MQPVALRLQSKRLVAELGAVYVDLLADVQRLNQVLQTLQVNRWILSEFLQIQACFLLVIVQKQTLLNEIKVFVGQLLVF